MMCDDTDSFYTSCNGCRGRWCRDCKPETVVYCTGPDPESSRSTDAEPMSASAFCALSNGHPWHLKPCQGYFSGFCKGCAWDEDDPQCFACDVCDGIWCTVCLPARAAWAKNGNDFACPACKCTGPPSTS
jgi:hypothetical protein